MTCDHCGERFREDELYTCTDCWDHVCKYCVVDGSEFEEDGRQKGYCNFCNQAAQIEAEAEWEAEQEEDEDDDIIHAAVDEEISDVDFD